MIDLPIEKKETKKTVSFTVLPSTLALVKEYAEMKGTTASDVMDTLARHFLPKIIAQEKERYDRG